MELVVFQVQFGTNNMLQPSPMMQQNGQPIVYSLVRPPSMGGAGHPVLISRPGMQGPGGPTGMRNPFGGYGQPPQY